MNPKRARVATALAVMLCLSAGCADAHTTAATTSTTPPIATAFRATSSTSTPSGSPSNAALHAATILFGADTATDASFNASWLRHRALLTPAFAQQLARAAQGSSDAHWQAWASHKAVLSVTAELITDDQPTDTPTIALRHLELTLTPRGSGGWRGAATQLGVVFTLGAVDGRWLVGGVRVDV